jgi:MinD superfamily P-loop ATPase
MSNANKCVIFTMGGKGGLGKTGFMVLLEVSPSTDELVV